MPIRSERWFAERANKERRCAGCLELETVLYVVFATKHDRVKRFCSLDCLTLYFERVQREGEHVNGW